MEANLCLIVDHDSSDSEVSSYGENDYDALYDAFQQLLFKSSKLDVAHKKLKFDFKELQNKFERSLEEKEVLRKIKFQFKKIKRLKLLNVHLVKVICLI